MTFTPEEREEIKLLIKGFWASPAGKTAILKAREKEYFKQKMEEKEDAN